MVKTIFLTAIAFGVLGVVTWFLYSTRAKEKREFIKEDKPTLDSLLEYMKKEFAEVLREDTFAGRTDEEYAAALNRKELFEEALTYCSYGILRHKLVVKRAMVTTLAKKLTIPEEIIDVIDLNGRFLDPNVKWEILMHMLKKKHKADTLAYLIHKYHLDKPHNDIEDGEAPIYKITTQDLNYVFAEELGTEFELEYPQMLEILATIEYNRWKGFGVIETLREQNIDGINGGVSGSIMPELNPNGDTVAKAPRSVWIYFEGKRMHLEFLTFGSENELARVCKLLIRYGKQGQIVDKHPYIVTSMADKSRLVVFRPNMSEYWAFVIRKFVLKEISLEFLMAKRDSNGELIIDNVHEAMYLLKILLRAQFSPIVTGRQGSGKTTATIALIKYFNSFYSIRTAEMTFELFLREIYPDRNILGIMETPYVTLMEGQDALKKADSDILVIGEIAQDKVALNYVQAHHTYMQTIATHHGATAEETVSSLSDSAMRASGSNDIDAMQREVSKAIDFDFHYDYDASGFRYLARVTEVIPNDTHFEFTKVDPKNLELSVAQIQREYYIQSTDKRNFLTKDIIVYNPDTKHYDFKNFISPRRVKLMLERLQPKDKEEFKEFAQRNWGGGRRIG